MVNACSSNRCETKCVKPPLFLLCSRHPTGGPAEAQSWKKTGVALLIRHRGHCELLWAVVPPLQVVLSSACSVASLGRFPSHYLPGRPHLRGGVLADHLFGWGIPSTRQAGRATVHSASSVKSPCGAQGGMTLPNERTVGPIKRSGLYVGPPTRPATRDKRRVEQKKLRRLGACVGGFRPVALSSKYCRAPSHTGNQC